MWVAQSSDILNLPLSLQSISGVKRLFCRAVPSSGLCAWAGMVMFKLPSACAFHPPVTSLASLFFFSFSFCEVL